MIPAAATKKNKAAAVAAAVVANQQINNLGGRDSAAQIFIIKPFAFVL
jgi:hypothetical protein